MKGSQRGRGPIRRRESRSHQGGVGSKKQLCQQVPRRKFVLLVACVRQHVRARPSPKEEMGRDARL